MSFLPPDADSLHTESVSKGPASLLRRVAGFLGSHKFLFASLFVVVVVAIAGLALWMLGFLGFVGIGDAAQPADAEVESTTPRDTVASSSAATDPAYPVTAIPGIPPCQRTDTDSQESEQWDVSEIERAALTGVVQVLTDLGRGSGFVVDSEGIVVTDSQVIAGSWLIRVRLADGSTLNGELFGIDERIGVAYIEVDADEDLEPIPLGNSDEVCVGDAAFAAGYPHSGDPDQEVPGITQGMISASIGSGFKTDVALNPGSVGGPLLNTSGLVVGVTSSGIEIIGDSVASASNFAIPINGVKQRLADGLEREDLTTTVFLSPRTPTPLPVSTVPPTPAPVPTAAPVAASRSVPVPTATATPARLAKSGGCATRSAHTVLAELSDSVL